MTATPRADRATSPWIQPGYLAGIALLGFVALACRAADPCDRTGAGALCLDLAGARTYTWGFAAGSIAIVDLDADGHPDLVASGAGRKTLGVQWGSARAGGTKDMFEGTATTWPLGARSSEIVVADLDADGHLDVATLLPEEGALAVLRGRGGRELAEPERFPVGDAPRAVAVADLDAGGPPELVVASEGDGTLTVFKNLVAAPPLAVGPGPRALASADLDADGHLDLAVALAEAGVIQILLGDGHGVLTPGPRHPVGVAPSAVVAADLDADGAVDLATLDVLEDRVTILYGDGQARLRARTSWPVDADPRALVVAADDAGQPVLHVMSGVTGNIQRVDPRRGAGPSGTPVSWPSLLLVGDLDGDGRDALVYFGYGSVLGELAPGPGLKVDLLWQRERTGVTFPVDLDGDGVDESVVDLHEQPEPDPAADPLDPPSRVLEVWRGPEPVDLELDSGLTGVLMGAAAADFDDDGRVDLALWDRQAIAVLVARDDGSFAPGVPAPLPGDPNRWAIGRGDDGVRIVFIDYAGLLPMGLGPDGALVPEAGLVLEQTFATVTAVDLAGDGRTDLVVPQDEMLLVVEDMRFDVPPRHIEAPGVDRGGVVVLVAGDHDGPDALLCGSGRLLHIPDLLGPGPRVPAELEAQHCLDLAVVDLDGDGRDEVVSMRSDGSRGEELRIVMTPWLYDDHTWRPLARRAVAAIDPPRFARVGEGGGLALLSAAAGARTVAHHMSLGTALADHPRAEFGGTLSTTFGDFDGDGALDLFTAYQSLGIAFGDGDGGFGPMQHRADVFPPDATIQSAFAIEGDGVDRLVLGVNTGAGAGTDFFLLDLVDGRLRPRPLFRSPEPSIAPLLGDLDGDGRPDLLVALAPVVNVDASYEFGVYRLAWLRSTADGFAEPRWSKVSFPASFFADFALADLDGDGRLDLVNSDGRLAFAPGLGDGRFGPSRTWSDVVANNFAVADVDRDGRPDMVAVLSSWNQYNQWEYRLVMLPGGVMAGAPQVLSDVLVSIDIADLDADGELELIGAGQDSSLSIGRRRDGRYHFERHELPGNTGRAVSTRDVDHDGLRDILLAGSGSVTIVRQLP